VFSFLDVRDPQVRSWLLDDGKIFEHVRKDRVESLIEKASLPNSESKFLFNFVSARMFLEEFAR
jgi:asparagine synthase (glutamine-hydrolysing)